MHSRNDRQLSHITIVWATLNIPSTSHTSLAAATTQLQQASTRNIFTAQHFLKAAESITGGAPVYVPCSLSAISVSHK
jgi:hypothetical protein